MQNCRSNFIFTGKGFIQFQLRDRRSDHIKHIRLDLTPWIGQTIISGICAFAQHTELHRHGDLVKYRVRQCVRESEQSNTNGGGGWVNRLLLPPRVPVGQAFFPPSLSLSLAPSSPPLSLSFLSRSAPFLSPAQRHCLSFWFRTRHQVVGCAN